MIQYDKQIPETETEPKILDIKRIVVINEKNEVVIVKNCQTSDNEVNDEVADNFCNKNNTIQTYADFVSLLQDKIIPTQDTNPFYVIKEYQTKHDIFYKIDIPDLQDEIFTVMIEAKMRLCEYLQYLLKHFNKDSYGTNIFVTNIINWLKNDKYARSVKDRNAKILQPLMCLMNGNCLCGNKLPTEQSQILSQMKAENKVELAKFKGNIQAYIEHIHIFYTLTIAELYESEIRKKLLNIVKQLFNKKCVC